MFKTYATLEDAPHTQPRVTAVLSCQSNLMSLSWHMPISKSPFRYAIAVRKENYTYSLLEKFKSFTLNFLPFEYHNEVNFIGHIHGDKHDKQLEIDLQIKEVNQENNLILSKANFVYECTLCDTYINGDHTIFIADVTKIYIHQNPNNKPLLFLGRGRYTTTQKEIQITKEL